MQTGNFKGELTWQKPSPNIQPCSIIAWILNGTCDIMRALTKVKLRRNIVTTLRWCRFRFSNTRNVFTLSTIAATKIIPKNNAFITREFNVSFPSEVVLFVDIFVWFDIRGYITSLPHTTITIARTKSITVRPCILICRECFKS